MDDRTLLGLAAKAAGLALAGECKGLTGIDLVRRAIVWDVSAAEIGRNME